MFDRRKAKKLDYYLWIILCLAVRIFLWKPLLFMDLYFLFMILFCFLIFFFFRFQVHSLEHHLIVVDHTAFTALDIWSIIWLLYWIKNNFEIKIWLWLFFDFEFVVICFLLLILKNIMISIKAYRLVYRLAFSMEQSN